MYSSLTNNSVLRSHSQLQNSWSQGSSIYSSLSSMTKNLHRWFFHPACNRSNDWNNHLQRQLVDLDPPGRVRTAKWNLLLPFRCSIVEKHRHRKDQIGRFRCSSSCCAYTRHQRLRTLFNFEGCEKEKSESSLISVLENLNLTSNRRPSQVPL